MSRAVIVLALMSSAAGCGLALDFDPPDLPDGGADIDARTPPDCETDVDCDDGNACDGRESCALGECLEGEPIACHDGDVCDGVDACVDGECVASEAAPCPADDGDPCNGIETCDAVTGCELVPPPSCDDGVECTADSCTAGGCVHQPDVGLCEDRGEPSCDPILGCQYGFCDATVCAPEGCVNARCEGEICRRMPRCTADEACCAGTCVRPHCDDDDDCTTDSCGDVGCLHAPRPGASCDDGNACTGGEVCTSDARCVPSTSFACVDGDPCTANVCDPAVGCVTTNAPDGIPCNDGDECTGPDQCRGGTCDGSGIRACVGDANACTDERCDGVLGCVSEPTPRGTSCLGTGIGGAAACDGAGHCCGPEQDCDGDGLCECAGRCVSGRCSAAGCADRTDCDASAGQACCVATGGAIGYCYSEVCPECCVATTD